MTARAACAGLAPMHDARIAGERDADRKDRLKAAGDVCASCELRDPCLAEGLAGKGGGVRGGRLFEDRVAGYKSDDRAAVYGAPGRRERPPCGSPGGRKAHLKRGEPVDDACAEAYRAANRDRMAARRELERQEADVA